MVNRRNLYKKETLIHNLEKMVERIPQLDLPATIVEIHAFGGILREKEYLHDLDLLVLYNMTPEQKSRWENFRINFSTIDLTNKNRRPPIFELVNLFKPYVEQNIPLCEAVKDKKLARILHKKDVEPVWAGCFSWTDVLYNPHSFFVPQIEVVISRLLLGKGMKGLQLNIQKWEDFMRDKMLLRAKNFVLAWSREKPNIRKNLENRHLNQKVGYISEELDHFLNEEIPPLEREYAEVRDCIAKASLEANLKLNIASLDSGHVKIQRAGNESYDGLCHKCEEARILMRSYRKEITVLRELALGLEIWTKNKNDPYFATHPAEEWLVQYTLMNIPKRDVKEKDIRQILHKLGLPEEHVLSIKSFDASTTYENLFSKR